MHKRFLAGALAALMLLLTACSGSKPAPGSGGSGSGSGGTSGSSGPAAQTSGPKKGGTLVMGIESETDVLDPHREGGWITFRVTRQIFEPLVTEDLSKPASEVPLPPLKPALAERWEVSPDGKTYTFYLRKGVKFHDGEPFNAQAVDFNIRRVWDKNFQYYDPRSSIGLHTWQALKEIKIVDDNTIQLILDRPFEPFLRMIAQGSMGTAGIMSPAALKKWGQDQVGDHPVGTGPFKFVERVRGQKIVLERNNDYWGEKPYLDRVIFRPLPEAAARVTALQTGEADLIAVPPPDAIDQLKSKGFEVIMGTVPHVWYLHMNFKDPIIGKDVRIRQAIAMAIDRAGMAKNLLKDTATPAYSIQSPANEAFDPNFKDYPYDPEKAKQLLAEAGYPNGFETTFQVSVDGSGQLIPVPMAEWIQRDLAKIGIKVKLDTYEWITYLGKWVGGMEPGIGFNQMSWGFSTPYFLYIIAHSKYSAPTGLNSGRYQNKTVDDLMDKATQQMDPKQAQAIWKQVNEQLSKDVAFIPVISDKAPHAMSKKVKGFVVPAQEWFDLKYVWLDGK